MRRPPMREDRGRLDVKMTPMIDVVFQLLIFFVCTVSFQALEEQLPANLQATGTGTAAPALDAEMAELEEVLVKLIARDGRVEWTINDRPYATFDEVRRVLRQLAKLRSDLPVILDIDGEVPVGGMIDVFDVCRLAGFEKILFAASREAS
jgi:biopolymer transport protein ExbD